MGANSSRYTKPGGRTHVWLHGRCMTGPDYRGTILTLLLAVFIFATLLGVSFPYILPRYPGVSVPLLLLLIASFVATTWSAFLASTTDPGIIPRSDTLPPSILAFPAVRERKLVFRGRSITLRFCDTCKIWRPPRTSHCATCNNCVRRFDHHCPWLGNDIGIRNYRSYFAFVVSASIAEATVIATSALTLHLRVDSFRGPLDHPAAIRKALSTGPTAVNLVLIVLAFLAFLFTAGLTGFHLYLMWNNVTTAESFKRRARNHSCDQDEYRRFKAIFYLQGTTRPPSAVTQGFQGERYPFESDFLRLIDEQVEMERAVTVPGRVANIAHV